MSMQDQLNQIIQASQAANDAAARAAEAARLASEAALKAEGISAALTEKVSSLETELAAVKGSIQLQGQVQTDIELNQFEQTAILTKIDEKLGGASNE